MRLASCVIGEGRRLAHVIEQAIDPEVRLKELEAQVAKTTAEVARLLAQKEVLLAANVAKDRTIADLQHKLEQALRRVYGRSAEKLDLRQIRFAFVEALDAEEASQKSDPTPEGAEDEADVEVVAKADRKRETRNLRELPRDLPTEERRYEPEASELTCCECGGAKRPMGEEVTTQLEFVPASLRVVRHVRAKYSCASCQEGVVVAPKPVTPLERSRPGSGLLAHLVLSKFVHHLPLYRVRDIYARYGVEIARSSLSDWVASTAFLLRPIVKEMKRSLLTRPIVQSDDTPIRVLNNGPGAHRASLWVYRGEAGEIVFEAKPNRKNEWPIAFLKGFKGYVQADAYSGYDALFRNPDVLEAGCWAHTRRKFYEARDTATEDATRALADIGRIYHIDASARREGLDAESLRRRRAELTTPIVDEFFAWAEAAKGRALPKSPIGQALAYALNQRTALCRFLEDGRLELDTNAIERAIRPVAVGRKNWLFAGSDEAADAGAILYSLVGSCRELGIDPFVYLKDVIDRVSVHPDGRVSELTPRGWLEARKN